MTLQVAVGNGANALLDEADVALVSAHKWYVLPGKKTNYAATAIKGRTVYMHRLIMGNPRLSVDHINGDGLDNRRGNLRTATASQQARNSRPKGGRSRYKGVSLHKASGLWVATIQLPGARRIAKYSRDEREAARLYNELASEHFGEFARLNNLQEVA